MEKKKKERIKDELADILEEEDNGSDHPVHEKYAKEKYVQK